MKINKEQLKISIGFWSSLYGMGLALLIVCGFGLSNGVDHHPEWADQMPSQLLKCAKWIFGGITILGIIIEINDYKRRNRCSQKQQP